MVVAKRLTFFQAFKRRWLADNLRSDVHLYLPRQINRNPGFAVAFVVTVTDKHGVDAGDETYPETSRMVMREKVANVFPSP